MTNGSSLAKLRIAALATACFVFLYPSAESLAAGDGASTSADPRPSGAEILTWYPPDAGGYPAEPDFEPYRDSAGTVVRLSREEMIPFSQYGKPLGPDTLYYSVYKRTAERFPDVQSCLADGERVREQPDLTKFDWLKFSRGTEAEVCLFRIATSYRSAEGFAKWLASQGFTARSGYIIEYRSDRNYPSNLDFIVHGRWSVLEKGALIYRNAITKQYIEKYIHSFSVSIRFRVDFGILRTSAGYDSK